MLNHELFLKDPRSYTLPNGGVASATEPTKPAEWEVLRHELESFICDGQYQTGLARILKSFLDTQGSGSVQSAAWISGFYGSGKSHLARMLKFLWANQPLDDSTLPRALVSLTPEVSELLVELSNRGRSQGGVWSAIGQLNSGAADSPRLAFGGVLLSAARLPTDYAAAMFVLWLRHENIEAPVRAFLEARGKTLEKVLPFFRMDGALRDAVLEARPDLQTPAEVGALIGEQFPPKTDISDDELVELAERVLRGVASNDKLPLSLLVLDELQQYLGEDAERTLAVQNAIEALSKRLEGHLMIVATGQSALGSGGQLGKLQGRFAVRVQLSDADAQRVVREVVLRKKEAAKPALQTELDAVKGEIARHLVASKIEHHASEDDAFLLADYPILPTRRRFWEEALRALDRQGGAAQLRNQLRATHEANRAVAEQPLGFVVGADALFNQLRSDLLQNGVLQNETDKLIGDLESKKTPGDLLKARVLKITFLLNQLPAELGVLATEATVGDLLVENLRDAPTLRSQLEGVLSELTTSGQLLEVSGEFRVQTRESAGWNQEFNAARARFLNDGAQIASARANELNAAVNKALRAGGGLQILHGTAREKRELALYFSHAVPTPDASAGWTRVPIWVRDGWNVSEKAFGDEALAQGMDSPLIHVFLPAQSSDEIRSAIAGQMAAEEVLQTRGVPTTREGEEAKAAMESRRSRERANLDALLGAVVRSADVRLSGGVVPPVGASLRATVLNAAEAALTRLFPEWSKADHDKWATVLTKAREGNASAFAAVGFTGDVEKHPIAGEVLRFVGSGKRGLDIKKALQASPYGWPQDAIYAALLALVGSQHLSASHSGRTRTVQQIETSQIGQTEFRRENITLSLPQKTAIKKLLFDFGLAVTNENLLDGCKQVAPLLEDKARRSGGDAPAPSVPTLHELAPLEANTGNALALEIYNSKDRLLELWNQWSARADGIAERLPRWNEWNALLDAAPNEPTLESARGVRDAMKRNRSLLDEPDPLTPVWNETLDALGKALDTAHAAYERARINEIERLQANTLWNDLDESKRNSLLARHELNSVPAPEHGDAHQLAASLRACSLASWRTRAAALHAHANAALAEAAQELAPKAVRLALPSAHIESAAQIDEFLETLRGEIEAELARGHSVLI